MDFMAAACFRREGIPSRFSLAACSNISWPSGEMFGVEYRQLNVVLAEEVQQRLLTLA
jgi:hypothetical protein